MNVLFESNRKRNLKIIQKMIRQIMMTTCLRQVQVERPSRKKTRRLQHPIRENSCWMPLAHRPILPTQPKYIYSTKPGKNARESSIHFMRHWWDYSVNPARIAVRRASSIWPYPNNATRVQTKSAKAFTNSWAMFDAI